MTDKQYYYRNGQPAKIIATDHEHPHYPILSQDPDGCRHTHTATGKFNRYHKGEQDYDILDYPTAAAPVPLPPPSPAFDPTRPCRYRNGETPRILCTDRPQSPHPILTLAKDGEIHIHDAAGRNGEFGLPEFDLQNIPERITGTLWLNVYRDQGHGGLWGVASATRAEADGGAHNHRLACIPVPIDCVEGAGLS